MKILMIAPQPFFEPRGTPISVYQRLTALSQLGYEIDLLTYHIGETPIIPGVTIYRSWRIPFVKQIRIGPSWIKPLLDLLIFFKALMLLLKNRYDVIHSHEEAAFMALILAPVFRTLHLYDMHSSLPRQLESYKVGNWWPLINLFEWLEKLVINSCDAIIVIDKDLEHHVRAINPDVNQLSIENINIDSNFHLNSNNGLITAPQIREKLNLHNKVAVIYTGTFEKYQGLDLVVRSVQKVKQYYPHVIYIMVGGKPNQIKELKGLAIKLGIDDYIHFPGIVSPAEALVYLEAADILVSSRIEGTSVPLKVYSYLHAGKPIVATKLEAHTQVFNEQISLLVDPTVEALANGVLALLNNPEKMSMLGRCAKSHALEFYSMDNYRDKVEKIYRSLKATTRVSKKQFSTN